jgi:rhodanese-related sulfurtransferase
MKNIDVKELNKLVGTINIVDVREPDEYNAGHIPTAKNIPMNGLAMNAESFLKKDETYYIVCQSGGRSQMVINHLSNQGFDLINVEGGTGMYAQYFAVEK